MDRASRNPPSSTKRRRTTQVINITLTKVEDTLPAVHVSLRDWGGLWVGGVKGGGRRTVSCDPWPLSPSRLAHLL